MSRRYNSVNRIGVKRGPYTNKGRGSRSKVIVDENGKINYYNKKKLVDYIVKNYPDGSKRDTALNELNARIMQARFNKTKLTSTSFYGYESSKKYRDHSDEYTNRQRTLANMGVSEQDIIDSINEELNNELKEEYKKLNRKFTDEDKINYGIIDLIWDNTEKNESKFYVGDYTFKIVFDYTGKGFTRM